MLHTNRVELQFPNMNALWKFAQKISSKSIEINTPTKKLICHCTEQELDEAIKQFGARLLQLTQMQH